MEKFSAINVIGFAYLVALGHRFPLEYFYFNLIFFLLLWSKIWICADGELPQRNIKTNAVNSL